MKDQGTDSPLLPAPPDMVRNRNPAAVGDDQDGEGRHPHPEEACCDRPVVSQGVETMTSPDQSEPGTSHGKRQERRRAAKYLLEGMIERDNQDMALDQELGVLSKWLLKTLLCQTREDASDVVQETRSGHVESGNRIPFVPRGCTRLCNLALDVQKRRKTAAKYLATITARWRIGGEYAEDPHDQSDKREEMLERV